jgi:hypothetical protein
LTIQLLPQFGFGHRTLKSDILTIQLLKPFTIDHQAVLIGGFNSFYLQFSPSNLKGSLLFARSSDLGDPCGHMFIMVSLSFYNVFIQLYNYFLYYFSVVV